MIQWRLRIKAERDNRNPYRRVQRLMVITLAWLLLVSSAGRVSGLGGLLVGSKRLQPRFDRDPDGRRH